MSMEPDLKNSLKQNLKFWKLKVLKNRIFSVEKQFYESLFKSTHTWDNFGCYTIRFLMEQNTLITLGESR